ncbi:MAG: DUF5011 domain-containing protein [Lachnospiraceae bacterium]|nr:DUF5011 domain-containing protein [Lachnospiraceae bacterium]
MKKSPASAVNTVAEVSASMDQGVSASLNDPEKAVSASEDTTVSEDRAILAGTGSEGDIPAETETSLSTSSETQTAEEEEPEESQISNEFVPLEWEDTDAPIFLSFKASPYVKLGDTFDIHKYMGYGDDVDRDVDLKVEGKVDTSKEGDYKLKITITDDTGKSTSKNMEVHVVKTVPKSSSSSKKEQFSDFVANYKADDNMLGIDVSRWQETIDFEKVKAAGCEFVIMRLGGYDNGECFTDRCFVQNMAGAKAAGLKIGIYWYAEESSPEEIKESVKYLMEVLGGEKLDFPIAYDWEDHKNFEKYGINLHDLNDCYSYFEQEIEKYGYYATQYASKNSHINIWTHKKKNPVWLAQYYHTNTYEGDYFMWQHSNTGRIDGIKGDVDLDIYYPGKLSLPR